jgi:hypothetical protein
MAEAETRTHITQVGTVIVPVSNQDRALEFYVERSGAADVLLPRPRRQLVPDRPGSLSCEGGMCIA